MLKRLGMKANINWGKVLANGGLAFFTALAGMGTASTLLNLELPLDAYLFTSFAVAGIQSGMAICRELSTEFDQPEKKKLRGSCSSTCRLFDYFLIF